MLVIYQGLCKQWKIWDMSRFVTFRPDEECEFYNRIKTSQPVSIVGAANGKQYRTGMFVEWAEENCEGLIFFNFHKDPGRWHFELASDAMAFKLVWGF